MKTPSFRYEGGKVRLRKWIAGALPREGTLYVEPFAGRGNVFWHVCRVCRFKKWWLNDIRTSRFLEALRSADFNRLPSSINRLEADEWLRLKAEGDPLVDLMEPVISWSGGILHRGMYTVGIGECRYDPWKYWQRLMSCRRLLEWTQAKITCKDWQKLPWGTWGSGVCAYVDPPYLNADLNSYSDGDLKHEDLVKTLLKVNCRWVLSEYAHPIYLEAFGPPFAQKRVNRILTNKNHRR
jgi:site-specific DNA-adenine methylase